MMTVTGRQSGRGPASLWEMTLFGPTKVRLGVDTYSYDNHTGGILLRCLHCFARGHTHMQNTLAALLATFCHV